MVITTPRFPPPTVGKYLSHDSPPLPWGYSFRFSGRNLRNRPTEPVDSYLVIRSANSNTIISNRTEVLFGQSTAVWSTSLVVSLADVSLDDEIVIECRDYDIGGNVGCGPTLFKVHTCLRELTLRREERSATFICPRKMILVLEEWKPVPTRQCFLDSTSIPSHHETLHSTCSLRPRKRRFRITFRGEKLDKKDMGGLKHNDAFLVALGTPLCHAKRYPYNQEAQEEICWHQKQISRLLELLGAEEGVPQGTAQRIDRRLDPTAKRNARRLGVDQFADNQYDRAYLMDLLYRELDKLSPGPSSGGLQMVSSERDTVIARTEVITSATPKWQPVEIDTLLTGGMSQPFTLAVYDWDHDGTNDLVGAVQVSISALLAPDAPRTFTLINSTKRKSSLLGKIGLYRNAGTLVVENVEEVLLSPDQPPSVFDDEAFQAFQAFRFTFECKNLKRMDGLLGKSDPFVVIRSASAGGFPSPAFFDSSVPLSSPFRHPHRDAPAWSVMGKTEVIFNNLNPTWQPLELDVFEHCGGMDSPLRVEVYDFDDTTAHDLIGSFETTLRQLIMQGQNKTTIPLQLPGASPFNIIKKNRGLFSVSHIEPIVRTSGSSHVLLMGYTLKLQARQLPGVELKLGKLTKSADPFLVVHAQPYGSNRTVPIYKSEVHKANLNPTFEPLSLDVLSCGGWDSPIRLEFIDWDRDFSHDHICSLTTTLRELSMPVNVIHIPNCKANLVIRDKQPLYSDEESSSSEENGRQRRQNLHLKQFPAVLGYTPQTYACDGFDEGTKRMLAAGSQEVDLAHLRRKVL